MDTQNNEFDSRCKDWQIDPASVKLSGQSVEIRSPSKLHMEIETSVDPVHKLYPLNGINALKTINKTLNQIQESLELLYYYKLNFKTASVGTETLTNSDFQRVSEMIKELQRRNYNPLKELQALSLAIEYLQCIKDMSPNHINIQNALSNLEQRQVNLLVQFDSLVVELKTFSAQSKTEQPECVTWTTTKIPHDSSEESEYVQPPFATCVLNEYHIMMYNILRSQSESEITLKVVVEDYLHDIPLNVQIRDNLECVVVTVVVIPEIVQNQVTGAKVLLFMDQF